MSYDSIWNDDENGKTSSFLLRGRCIVGLELECMHAHDGIAIQQTSARRP